LTEPHLPLDELELDALTEIANIGVGKAATSLREMTQAQVHLSVPRIALISRALASQTMKELEASPLVGVHQTFEGDLSGRALLIFPETNSLHLVRAVAGRDLAIEDIIALEHEALAETGNIILNACLATMANMLRKSLKMSLPQVVHGDSTTIFDLAGEDAAGAGVLFLHIDFSIRDLDIRGYITVLMDLPALVTLKKLLGEFIERVAKGE
jgi:chemotaxis protein CheC